jgi:hypothetical protein
MRCVPKSEHIGVKDVALSSIRMRSLFSIKITPNIDDRDVAGSSNRSICQETMSEKDQRRVTETT